MASTWRDGRLGWIGVIAGLGVIAFFANLPHLLNETGLIPLIFGVLFPMGLAVGLVLAAGWIYRSDLDADLLPRVTMWVLAGVLAMAVVTAAVFLYQHAEGGRFTHAEFVVLNLLTTGGLAGVIIGVYDGRRRQVHRAAEANVNRYQTLLDASPDAILVADTESGEIIEANAGAESLLGRPREEILDMHQSELHPSGDADQYRQLFSRHVEAGSAVMTVLPDGSDIYVTDADGDQIPVEINAATFDHGGQALLLGVFRDISGRRERERTLQRRTEQLTVLNRVVRHDIRNDLNVVIGHLEMLDSHVDEAGDRILDRVSRASHHVIELTDIAGDYIEVVSGESDTDIWPVSLANVLEDELDTRRETFPAAAFRLEGSATDVEVLANGMLSSVFRNLLNNAVQHNHTASPEVVVEVEVDDDAVVVSVADDGPGIPDAQKDSVFGRGEKGLESPGTGVGLYLVQTLIEAYGGEVWIVDNEPRGTVVTVRLRRP